MQNRGRMDYELIYKLYDINKKELGESTERGIRQNLNRWFKEYLKYLDYPETLTMEELSQTQQDYFICTTIKDKMTSKFPRSKKTIEENINNYMHGKLLHGEDYLNERNKSIDNLKERNYIEEGFSTVQKEKAYDKFCKVWRGATHIDPITYEQFLKNPNLSVYDYIKSEEQESYLSVSDSVNGYVVSIITEFLKENLGLNIDIDSIKECFIELAENRYNGEADLSFYDDEKFPLTFDKFLEEQVEDKELLSDEELENIRKDYEEMRTFLVKQYECSFKLSDLKNFYTIDEFKLKKFLKKKLQ